MKTDKFFRRWQRHYQKLAQRQWVLLRAAREQGTPEQIHELRVTLRRLRLMARVSGPLFSRKAAQDYRLWSRGIATATSHLRDYDVAIEWLLTREDVGSLVTRLRARRTRLWHASRRRLVPPKPALRAAIARFRPGRKGRQQLCRRFPERFERLQGRVKAGIPRFFQLSLEDRHAFRRTVRLLRYLREFAMPRRRLATDPLLGVLIPPQTAMGEYQNLLLARQILESLTDPPPPPDLLAALSRDQQHWQARIRVSLRALARDFTPIRTV